MSLGFGLAGRLADWRRAGLIDADQAERIAAFEAARGRPKLALTLAALGGFTIAVGIIAIVAANWDAIPIAPRLGLHVLLNLALATALWVWGRRGGAGLALRMEGGLLLLSLSTLALVAHIGQSFQLQGSLTGLLGIWLLLTTPATLVLAREGLNRWVWTVGLFTWVGLLLEENWSWLHGARLSATALVLVLAGLYALRAAAPPLRPVWARHFGQVAAGAVVTALTLLLLILRPLFDGTPDGETMTDAAIGGGVGLLALGAAHLLVPADRRGARLGFGVVLALSPPLAVLPFLLDGTAAAIVTGILFCLYWIALARLALLAQRPGWFRLAVALIAIRVFVAYLDATGGLLATGLGLVLAGILLLILALAARRVMEWGTGRGAGAST